MKDQQKYFSEVALLQATKGVALLKPAELTRVKELPKNVLTAIEESHIYFICQRPRVRIASISNRITEGIRIFLEISTKKDTISKEFLLPDKFLPQEATSARIIENGNYFTITNGKDDITPFLPPDILLKAAYMELQELAMLEVIYIGQAYGDTGTRSAIERLSSHSTLQKVLAIQAHNYWWLESVILLFLYDKPQLISKMDGRGRPEITDNDDMDHYQSVIDNPLPCAQLVTIAEASLIRYFKPYYNIHFKGNYPTSELEHLRQAYRLDYNAIVTEIDTEDIFMSTFAECQKPRMHHIAKFDLHNPKERRSFFAISRK